MTINIKFLGHSAFFIQTAEYGILIDPFISQNPLADLDYKNEKITHIILTHAHGDHLGDAIPIAKSTGAVICAVFELGNYCASLGAKVVAAGLGGEVKLDFGSIWFLPAVHTSSLPNGQYAGVAASVMIKIDGKRIFHAGDTALSAEMQLIGEVYKPDVAMLPIGGFYTMGIREAVVAAKLLGAREVIPMHYDTFDVIKADVSEFSSLIEGQGQKCVVMTPNSSMEI